MASAIPTRMSNPPLPSPAAGPRRDGLYTNNRRSIRRSRSSIESLHHKRAQQSQSLQPEPVQMKSGQQFRVGNVTSNGRLQLRPVAGDSQAYPSPPTSPVRNSPLIQNNPPPAVVHDDWRESLLSGSVASYEAPAATPAVAQVTDHDFDSSGLPGLSRGRSHSFSTASDHVAGDQPERHSTANGIKILIDKPDSKRPASSIDQSVQLLQVSIPHYRLGTPHFSGKGSAVLHSSINTGSSFSNGLRSSTLSARDLDQMFPRPPHTARRSYGNQMGYFQSIDPALPQNIRTSIPAGADQLRAPPPQATEPTALIELESQPLSPRSRSLIRLSRLSGQIIAASPSGLIAQITSPNLLDYELLSDFFLTFRSYITTHELLVYLLTRLQWAISRSDDFGRIVRVRTFVALRHWILNYFVDDFVSDHTLRVGFCIRVNELCTELQSRSDGGGGDLKILGELKRCWRRTCAQYWEISEHRYDAANDDILPGRPLGYMSASINLDALDSPLTSKPQLSTKGITPTQSPSRSKTQIDSAHPHSDHPRPFQKPFKTTGTEKADPQHRMSDQSAHIVSCSIPIKIGPSSKQRPQSQIHAGPQIARVKPPSSGISPGPSSNALLYHSRTGSFSDALRDNRTAVSDDKEFTQGTASTLFAPLAPGCLVRGYIVQPGPPYVESSSTDNPADEKLAETFSPDDKDESIYAEDRASPSSPGMKRFFGSVRRALSTRQGAPQPNMAERQRTLTKRSPRGSGVPLSRTSSRATYGTPKRQVVAGRTKPRVDMLALCVLERYQSVSNETPSEEPSTFTTELQQRSVSDQASNQGKQALPVPSQQSDPRIQSSVTMGSRSIVIVDDTGDRPPMPQRPLTQISRYGRSPNMGGSEFSAGRSPNFGGSEFAAGNEFRQTIPIGVDTRPASSRDYQSQTHLNLDSSPRSLESNPIATAIPVEHNLTSASEPPQDSFLNDTGMESELLSEATPPASQSGERGIPSVSDNSRAVEEPLQTYEDSSRDHQPQLRRRPGGDLRAVDHVHSLEEHQNRQSVRSSSSEAPQETRRRKKETDAGTPISVIATHSSQTVLRPSFENAVAKLAQLPDDSDDGGIESTLRKLEGNRMEYAARAARDDDTATRIPLPLSPHAQESVSMQQRRHLKAFGITKEASTSVVDPQSTRNEQPPREGSISGSEVSDSSIPLLERGVSQRVSKKRQSSLDWLTVSLPREDAKTQNQDSSKPIPPATEKASVRTARRLGNNSGQQTSPRTNNPPKSSSTHKSFLLDDNQSLDSVAQNANAKAEGQSTEKGSAESFYFDDAASINQDSDLLPHPLRHPSTPPKSKDWSIPSRFAHTPLGPSLEGHIPQQDRDAFSAKATSAKVMEPLNTGNAGSSAVAPSSPLATSGVNNGSHLPFILAFDSMLLAQQFTLVEKDAISEVGWRQLIELRWNAHAKICSTWYDCLKPEKNAAPDGQLPGGVDMCITRFNMVVKWAASEIVLCQDISERVACIVKYIHIARHARHLRNWATMFQITMALVSADISRLKATWQEVPEKEREYLKSLENLITPTRNFHNLREEIDMAIAGVPAPGTDGGCVPFIGIYTHDLIYNSQKPAFAEPAKELESEEPLINFERHRTAATIVKNLLRLVDASSKYPFQPVQDVLSKCLWLATLEDEEISCRSRKLEP